MGIGLCVKESGLDEKQLSKQKLRERAGPGEEVPGHWALKDASRRLPPVAGI